MAETREVSPKGVHAVITEERAEVAAETAPAAADVNSPDQETTQSSSSALPSEPSEPGEIDGSKADTEDSTKEQLLQKHRWCRCACDPAQFSGQTNYYLHMDTQNSIWEEPKEPFWIWDAATQALDPRGLQQPSDSAPTAQSDGPDPEYFGYNPKIHGKYDPNAPYAKYHNQKRVQEASLEQGPPAVSSAIPIEAYTTAGPFNRFTGSFQTAEKSAERHDDYNKTGRQLAAHFDVDAAANAHNGRSLKEERRNEKFTKAQIKEMVQKRRAKKEKKRLDFYKS